MLAEGLWQWPRWRPSPPPTHKDNVRAGLRFIRAQQALRFSGMALPKVKSSAATKIIDTVDEHTIRTIRIPAAQPTVTLSRDSGVAAGSGFDVAAGASQQVVLRPGESLYGRAASAESTYEII